MKSNLITDNSYINSSYNIHCTYLHNSARYLHIWHFTVLFLPYVNIDGNFIYTSTTIEVAMYLDESLGTKDFSEQQTIVLCAHMYNVAHLLSGGYSMYFTKVGHSIWLLDR